MKPDIHPQYSETTFRCSCGAVVETRSTIGGERHVEVCSQCHPFFSGKDSRLLDTAGRIDKFKRRYKTA